MLCFPHSTAPIPTLQPGCQFIISRVWFLGVLKVSRFPLPWWPPSRISIHLQHPGHFGSLLFGNACPDPLLLQFLSTGRDFRPTCHNLPVFYHGKSPTKNWLQSCCSCLDGGGGVDPGPNSSYRDLIGEQVPSSDTGIGPSTLYLNTTYQHRTSNTEANVYWE